MPTGILLEMRGVERFSEAPVEVQVRQEPHLSNADTSALALLSVCLVIALVTLVMLRIAAHKHEKETFDGQQLSQTPCRSCQFFKDSGYLKCAVHPAIVLTKQSIDCRDYEPNQR